MKFDKFAKILEDRVKSLKLPRELKDERTRLKKIFDFFRSKTNTSSILRNAFEKNVGDKDRELFEKLLASGKYIGEDEIQYILMSLIIERDAMFSSEDSETTDADTVDADDTGEQEEEKEDSKSMDEKLDPQNFQVVFHTDDLETGFERFSQVLMNIPGGNQSGPVEDSNKFRVIVQDHRYNKETKDWPAERGVLALVIDLQQLKDKIKDKTDLTKIQNLKFTNGQEDYIYTLYFDPNNKILSSDEVLNNLMILDYSDMNFLDDDDEETLEESKLIKKISRKIKPFIREKLKRKQNGKKNLCN